VLLLIRNDHIDRACVASFENQPIKRGTLITIRSVVDKMSVGARGATRVPVPPLEKVVRKLDPELPVGRGAQVELECAIRVS